MLISNRPEAIFYFSSGFELSFLQSSDSIVDKNHDYTVHTYIIYKLSSSSLELSFRLIDLLIFSNLSTLFINIDKKRITMTQLQEDPRIKHH